VIYAGSRIGQDFETGHHVIVREENKIGDHVRIWNGVTVDYGCRIGQRVKIHCNGYIAQYSVLEDDVFLAPGVIFANDLYPGHPHSAARLRGPTIHRGAHLGVNVTILPYVHVGKGTLVGAGSVVTRDLPAGVVAWGNPARPYKKIAQLSVAARFSLLEKRSQG
jgi:acetyltransferase-like isoleucine patch superfamily enzyme